MNLALSGGVATITLSRPPVNALDESVVSELERILDRVDAAEASVIVFRSASERFFCAGADLSFFSECLAQGESGRRRMVTFVTQLRAAMQRIEQHRVPSIAAISGSAIGGGLELALACDLRIVGIDARLGLPEAKVGLLPGAGGTQRLVAIAGRAVASRLILTAELISGTEAFNLGIAQYLVGRDEAEATAGRVANEIAALPRTALSRIKECLAIAPSTAGYDRELQATVELFAEAETLDLIQQFLKGTKNSETRRK